MMTAHMAVRASTNQLTSASIRPRSRSIALTTPYEPSSIQRNTMETMTPGTAHGSSMEVRRYRPPGKLLFQKQRRRQPDEKGEEHAACHVEHGHLDAVPEAGIRENPPIIVEAKWQLADLGKVHGAPLPEAYLHDPQERIDDQEHDG